MNSTLPALILSGCMLAAALPLAARENDGISPLKAISFSPVDPPASGESLFAADSPALRYEGRFDTTQALAPRLNWQASRICVDFEGSSLTLLLENAAGKAVADIAIDGVHCALSLERGTRALRLIQTLAPGRHRLVIAKRSEASAGALRFRGLALDAGARLLQSPADYRSRMVFFGDSITVGACNEDGASDQWEDLLTHNSMKSYGVLLAQAVNADVQNIAISGMGMVTGWNNTIFAPQVWNRRAPVARGNLADIAGWTPDVVFTNFGENDASYTKANGKPFPDSFVATYIQYVQTLRAAWPKATIVILRGGMYHGKNDPDLALAIDEIRAAFANDPLVFSYNFEHWTSTHPRVVDHEAMRDELLMFFKQTDSLARFLP